MNSPLRPTTESCILDQLMKKKNTQQFTLLYFQQCSYIHQRNSRGIHRVYYDQENAETKAGEVTLRINWSALVNSTLLAKEWKKAKTINQR
ncbi:Hypothetical predicted protein [Podarcis lilfordi]|uniref:Uncharacterized protein n=1 Tax=Podarcis lilfordi TaxID=74358 RepID=A0AA35NWQ4_9SAUR|nr:Hypothetical predicted protein [Podarcis lilfordi]